MTKHICGDFPLSRMRYTKPLEYEIQCAPVALTIEITRRVLRTQNQPAGLPALAGGAGAAPP